MIELTGNVYDLSKEYLGWVDTDASKVEVTDIETGKEIEFKDGETYTVEDGLGISAEIHWNVPEGTEVKKGDQFTYQLPDITDFFHEDEPDKVFKLYDQYDQEIGIGQINRSGEVTMTVTGEGGPYNNFKFGMTGAILRGSRPSNKEIEVTFPGVGTGKFKFEETGETKQVSFTVSKYLNTDKKLDGDIEDMEVEYDDNGLIKTVWYYVSIKASGGNTGTLSGFTIGDTVTYFHANGAGDSLMTPDISKAQCVELKRADSTVEESPGLRVTESTKEPGKYDLNLPEGQELRANDELVFKYPVDIKPEFWLEKVYSSDTSKENLTLVGSYEATNNIEIKGKEGGSGQSSVIWHHTKKLMDKKGEVLFQGDVPYVHYTVYVYPGISKSLEYWTLSDSASDNQQYFDLNGGEPTVKFTLYGEDNKEKRTWNVPIAKGNEWSYYFEPGEAGEGDYAVIEYDAKYTGNDGFGDGGKMHNRIMMSIGGIGPYVDIGLNSSYYTLKKVCRSRSSNGEYQPTDTEYGRIDWESTIANIENASGSVSKEEYGKIRKWSYYKDWTLVDWCGSTDHDHYFTKDDIDGIILKAGEKKLNIGSDYTVASWTNADAMNSYYLTDPDGDVEDGEVCHAFSILFLEDVDAPVTISYHSHATFSCGTENYVNKGEFVVSNGEEILETLTDNDSASYGSSGYLSKEGYGIDVDGTKGKGILSWLLRVNNWFIYRRWPDNVSITERIPENQEFVGAWIYSNNRKQEELRWDSSAPDSSGDTLVTIHLDNPGEYQKKYGYGGTDPDKKDSCFEVLVETRTIEDLADLGAGGPKNFENFASLNMDGHQFPEVEAGQNVEFKSLGKEHSVLEGNVLSYVVDINPNCFDYIPNNGEDRGTLTVIDTMAEGMKFKGSTPEEMRDKIKIEQAQSKLGNFNPAENLRENIKIDAEGKNLTFECPDNVWVRLTYEVEVSNPKDALTVMARNGVKLQANGVTVSQKTDKVNIVMKTAWGGADGTIPVTIKKVSQEDGAPLGGAEFNLYKYGEEDWTSIAPFSIKDDGTFDGKFTMNTLYRLEETKAPSGYVIPEDPNTYFVVGTEEDFKEGLKNGSAVKETFEKLGKKVQFVAEGGKLVISDPPKKGELEVNKIVTGTGVPEDDDISYTVTVTGPEGMTFEGVTFSGLPEGTSQTTTDNRATFQIKKDSTVTIGNLPLGEYEVVEKTGTEGQPYRATYQVNGRLADDNKVSLEDDDGTDELIKGEVTITNTYYQKSGSLSVTKKVVNKREDDTEYGMTVTPAEGVKVDWEKVDVEVTPGGRKVELEGNGTGSRTFTIKKDETVTLSGLPEGDYTVKEVPAADGSLYTPSFSEITGCTIAPDGKSATLHVKPDATAAASVTVTNTYTGSVSVQFPVTKTLTGTPEESKEFTFDLAETDDTWSALPGGHTDKVGITVGPDDKTETGYFKEITYTQEDLKQADGTYSTEKKFYYTVEEEGTDGDGYTYDRTVYHVTVTVSTDAETGALKADVTYVAAGADGAGSYVDAMTFHNTYTAEGTVILGAKKSLKGHPLSDSQFTFELRDEDDTLLQTQTNNGERVTFDAIKYEKSGTYTYFITERNGGTGGYSYSSAEYTVVVEVTDDGDGTLKPDVKYYRGTEEVDKDKVVFENTYEANGSLNLIGWTKVVKGERGKNIEAGEFTFTVTELVDGREVLAGKGSTTDGDAGTAVINFGPISYKVDANTTLEQYNRIVGTHTYYIREDDVSVPGVSKDNAIYTVMVEVTDNNNGTLAASITSILKDTVTGINPPKTFVNTYEAVGEVPVSGLKLVNGRTPTPEQIAGLNARVDFQLWQTAVDSTTARENLGNENLRLDGTFKFDNLKYTEANIGHTYTYEIVEHQIEADGAMGGYTTDSTVYTFTVEVEKGTDAGALNLTVTGSSGVTVDALTSAVAVTFNNGYEATGRIKLEGTKRLDGGRAEDVRAGEFNFVVTENGETVATGTTLAGGEIEFKEIEYTLDDVGTHTYEVSEVIPTEGEAGYDPTIEYDTQTFTVKVKVTDNGNGTLKVEPTYPDGGIVFINTYEAVGEVPVSGFKLVNGRIPTPEQIEGLNARVDFQLWQTAPEGRLLESVRLGANGRFSFANLKYTEADIGKSYSYRIVEHQMAANSAMGGYTTDNTVYTFTVKVEKGTDAGALNLTVTGSSGVTVDALTSAVTVTFNNDYEAAGRIKLEGIKRLDGGRAEDVRAGEFNFVVTENGEQVATGTTLAGGEIDFTEIEYTLDDVGTHTYEVSEVIPAEGEAGYDPTIEYDTQTFTVTVVVTDNGDGTLNAAATYPEGGIVFINTYRAEGEVPVRGWKLVNGRIPTPEQIAGLNARVDFQLWQTDPEERLLESARLGANGRFSFTNLKYTQADIGKSYSYRIVEHQIATNSAMGGYTTDSTVYTFTVQVGEGAEDGKLNLTVTGGSGATVLGGAVEVTFDNDYEATGRIKLEGTKTLTGNRAEEVRAGEFSFVVTENGEIVATGTTLAGGEIDFTEIEYTLDDVGTHTYEVSEVIPAEGEEGYDPTITYSTQVFTVTVEVTDNGDGTLDAVATYPDGGIVFINDYKVTGSIVLTARKVLTGAELAAGQFTFELRDADGTLLQTKTNAADGTVTFDELTYTQEDIGKDFTYTISETNTGAAGITYDARVYTVTVHVEDAGDGTLDVTSEITLNGTPVDEALFENTFEGSVTLTKVNEEGERLPGAEFQLYTRGFGETEWHIYNGRYADGVYTTGVDGTLTVTGLPAGEYYFIETKAPAGYKIPQNGDGTPVRYSFTIAPEGSGIADAQANASLTVVDEREDEDTSLMVTKQVTHLGELWTAVDETFYVALFSDPELTDRVSDILPVEFRDQSASTVEFPDLEVGKTYYVAEVDASGMPLNTTGGVTEHGDMFQPTFGGDNAVTVVEGEGTRTVFFRNEFASDSPYYYRSAELTITKKLLGLDGTPKGSKKTFYAGIFSDPEFTTLADNVSSNIVALNLDGRDTASDTVEVTVNNGETATLYVTETDKNGHPVAGSASFKYDVTVDGSTVTLAQDDAQTVVITNQEREETSESEETESEEIKQTEPETKARNPEEETPQTEISKKSVKTGDETPLGLYIGLMAAAALLLLLLFAVRRRRNGRG